jgi:hypothetical protein
MFPANISWPNRNIALAAVGLLALTISLLSVLCVTMTGQAQAQAAPAISEEQYRRRDLEIKGQALEVAREAVKAGIGQKESWTTYIPLAVAVIALGGSVYSAVITSQAATESVRVTFTAKVAELALQGETTEDVIRRADLLAQLYEGLLPEDFHTRVRKLDAERIGRIVTQAPWTSELQKGLLELLAQNPQQRKQIITDYIAMFPNYEFLENLSLDPLKLVGDSL